VVEAAPTLGVMDEAPSSGRSGLEDAPAAGDAQGAGAPPAAPPLELPSPARAAFAGPLRVETVDVEEVRRAIDRQLIYPLGAGRMGWTGRVVVAFELDERGQVSQLVVLKSSGFRSLDDAAVEGVRRAAPFGAPSARVRIAVPVAFGLGLK